mmetsp:Transcript_42835/g.49237  ORF Transcript_42835/g.49237 Transcript_42835/m.49237 type:complete len:90 (-) Transcript_42835:979-1248(-)
MILLRNQAQNQRGRLCWAKSQPVTRMSRILDLFLPYIFSDLDDQKIYKVSAEGILFDRHAVSQSSELEHRFRLLEGLSSHVSKKFGKFH